MQPNRPVAELAATLLEHVEFCKRVHACEGSSPLGQEAQRLHQTTALKVGSIDLAAALVSEEGGTVDLLVDTMEGRR